MNIQDYLISAINNEASSVIITAGKPVCYRKNKSLTDFEECKGKLTPNECEELIKQLYSIANRPVKNKALTIDDEFTVSIRGLARFRANVIKQRNSLAAVIKIVNSTIDSLDSIDIPEEVMNIANYNSGIVIISGMARSGKSTTINSIINRINKTRQVNIVTIEDNIEFLHRNEKSTIMQREISSDTDSYSRGIRTAIRQQADVIVIGDFNSIDTIQLATLAAENGILVIAEMSARSIKNVIQQIEHSFIRQSDLISENRLLYSIKTIVNQSIKHSDNEFKTEFNVMDINDEIIRAIDNDNLSFIYEIASKYENDTNLRLGLSEQYD